MKEKVSILNHPLLWVSLWYKLHLYAYRVCGDWFGISVRLDGRMVVYNDEMLEFMHNLKWEEVENDN